MEPFLVYLAAFNFTYYYYFGSGVVVNVKYDPELNLSTHLLQVFVFLAN